MYQTFRKLWKGFWEPVLAMEWVQWVVAGLMAIAIWFVYFTCRKRIQIGKLLKNIAESPQSLYSGMDAV